MFRGRRNIEEILGFDFGGDVGEKKFKNEER